MKRYIRSSDDMFSSDYIPELSMDELDNILQDVRDKLVAKLGRRYKHIAVDIDDSQFGKNLVQADFIVYNGDKVIRSGNFRFGAYDDYFDESDFVSHLNRTIHDFVESMASR